ncbi:Mrp family chromosome partitioning ATPase [Arthrobacter sp. UYCu511]|uniref:AAA family ATPase n=1 Tax=Arthrobacter sp. UYCu511 TaxID=3156337 RepID=UPI0033932A39
MSPVTVVAVGDTPAAVIAELENNRGALHIVRRCPELAELLAACQNGLAQAAVVAEGADELSATLVDRLAAVGVSVVAVATTAEAAQRLRSIGAGVVTEHVSAELLAQVVTAAVQSRKQLDGVGGYAVPARAPTDVAASRGAHASTPTKLQAAALELTGAPEPTVPVTAGHSDTTGEEAGHNAVKHNTVKHNTADATDPAQHASLWERTRRRLRRRDWTQEDETKPETTKETETDPSPGSTPLPRPTPDPPKSALHKPDPLKPALSRPSQSKPALSRAAPSAPEPATAPAALSSPAAAPAVTAEATPALPGRTGMLVALWGPIGSPGRTTVAINLAAEQAAAGRSVLVIDADSYGASIGAALGLLEESASFAQACRAADQGTLSAVHFTNILTKVVFSAGTFSLLTGLTRADRWPELRAAAVARVVALARESADLVVVDCGFSLENDEELSYDTVAPRRNGATLTVLAQADIIYAVGSGDPVGIPRLIRGMNELQAAFPAARIDVVVNKVRRQAAGRAPEKALAQAWERFGPTAPIRHFLPWDPEITDRALLEGRLLLEVAPDSPLRRGISRIDCAAVQENSESAVTSTTAALQNQG